MSRRRQLLWIIAIVLTLTSALNHLTIRALNIRTNVIDRGMINSEAPGAPALALGSSLTFFGVSFRKVADALSRPILTRGVGGCSPCELEPLALEVPEATRIILGVSIFDLNETNLSDSRPLLVPFRQTVSDIWASHADWPYAKRVLWSYPLPWIQKIFPVAGRSAAVIVNLRDLARNLAARHPPAEPEARLSFNTEDEVQRPEKLRDWDAGRVARNIAQLRASGLARGHFHGPKSLALERILKRASGREPTLLLVLPVSPAYRQAFADPRSVAGFEEALRRTKTADPNLLIVRLDLEPSLQPAEVFWDLVHLNDDGRRIATRLVIEQLSPAAAR